MITKKNRFSGHQTFAFRYGWLEKGYRFAQDGKFSDENAIVALGVGKNMVESIKYWCEMTGVISNGELTEFAHNLLGEKGWDPFLEDDVKVQRTAMAKGVHDLSARLAKIRNAIKIISATSGDSEEKQQQISDLRALENELLGNIDLKGLRERAGSGSFF